MTRSDRHHERLSMGAGAVHTLTRASALLPIADDEARVWLQEQGLVRYLAGRPVVVWADVMDALRDPDKQPSSRPCPATSSLPRTRL